MPQHEEIYESLLSLGKDRACGWDELSARLLGLDAAREEMVQIIQQIWIEENAPTEVVQGILVMLHKGGGKSKKVR